MKHYILLTLCLLFLFQSCTKEEFVLNDKSSISLEDSGEIGLRHPGCCQIDVDVSHNGSTNLCCTYTISIVNENACPLYLDGPKGTNNSFANGLDGSIQMTICSEVFGQPEVFHVPIYWISPKNQIIVCETLQLSSECLECDFTYAQGFNIGCGFTDEANCCEQSSNCSTALIATITQFQDDCPDYVAGVIAGWEACCEMGSGTGGGTGGGGTTKFCGGEPLPPDVLSCECVNDVWVNCIFN